MNISASTIRRLSIYLRQLEGIKEEGRETVSSSLLAERSDVKATQLRKDLSYFGSFGVRGLGYSVDDLSSKISKILGLDREWRAVLFGAGSLGQALAGYKGFSKHNIRIVAIIDSDPTKKSKMIGSLPIEDASDLKSMRQRVRAEIAVIAVPGEAATALAEQIVAAGFSGIVNFAPVRLKVPPQVALYAVDLAIAFENVTYLLTCKKEKP